MLEIQAIIITSTQAICPFVTTSTLLANILTKKRRKAPAFRYGDIRRIQISE